MYRSPAVFALTVIFAIGVMCAIACPEKPVVAEHSDSQDDCEDCCISTEFFAESKFFSSPTVETSVDFEEAEVSGHPELLVGHSLPKQPDDVLPIPRSAKTVLRI